MKFIILFKNLKDLMSIMQDKYACTPVEFVLKYTLIYLGMKKTANEESLDKIKASEDNM